MAKTTSELLASTALTGVELVDVSQVSATVKKTGVTVSALASDNSFNDSANGFITAGFAVGDRVNSVGFATGGNNLLLGVITALTAGKMTISGAVLVNEAAGAAVTIAKWTTKRTTVASIAGLATFPDAPSDGTRYVRKDGAWSSIPLPIGDAPADGSPYNRKDNAWVAAAAGGISEAPLTGLYYARRSAGWQSFLPFVDAPSDGTQYVRKDGAWVANAGGSGGSATPDWAYGSGERRPFVDAVATVAGGSGGNIRNAITSAPINSFFFSTGSGAASIKFTFDVANILTGMLLEHDIVASQGIWSIEGSNDDVSYTTLVASFDWTPITKNGVVFKQLTWVNATAYKYYRMTKVSGSTSNANFLSWVTFKCQPIQPAGEVYDPHRYWRMRTTAAMNGGALVAISELVAAERIGGAHALGAVAPAYSSTNTGTAANTVDGNIGTIGVGQTMPVTLTWDLGATSGNWKDIRQLRINVDPAWHPQGPKTFTFQWSDDGVTWTDRIVCASDTSWDGNTSTTGYRARLYNADNQPLAAQGGYLWYRLNIASGNDATQCAIGEAELRQTVGGADEIATGGGAFWSHQSGGNVWANTYDNNNATGWFGTTGFPYQCGWQLPQRRVIGELSLIPFAGLAGYAPKDFTVEGSNDFVNWTVVKTVLAQTAWAANPTARTFAIP